MNLRLRVLIVVAFTSSLMFAVLYAASSSLVTAAMAHFEQQEVAREIERARKVVKEHLAFLANQAAYWASRDDTRAFMKNGDRRLVKNTLHLSTFDALDIDLLLLLHADGSLRAGGQRASRGVVAPTQAMLRPLRAGDMFVDLPDPAAGLRGFTLLRGRPLMVVVAPVPGGDRRAPARGTLLLGRFLTPERLHAMGAGADLALALASLNEAPEAVTSRAIAIRPAGQEKMTAYFPLTDLNGGAIALVRMETPRWIHAHGRAGRNALALGFFLVGVVFLAMLTVLLERLVLARLARIDRVVAGTRSQGGADELDRIERTVTETLKELHKTRAQLEHDALHDPLTGLPNRAFFIKRLEASLKKCRTTPKGACAVLLFDLDHFKLVNESFGHSTGDELLIAAAQRMAGCLRHADTVARLGGDEFAILLDAIADAADASRRAERILNCLRDPVAWHHHQLHVSASIGIAVFSGGVATADELMRDADTAMYRAKQNGRNCATLFDERMHEQVVTRLELENDLREAIRRGELRAYYQPLFDLRTRQIRGFEALVRWQHATRGLLGPDQFVPIAEAAGLIGDIDRWMLEESSRCLMRWQARFQFNTPLTISVNLSCRQLEWAVVTRQVQEILAQTRLDGWSIGLEITESALAVAEAELVTQLFALKALGVRLYLDDFGTGYSSLSRLHRLPIDVLKIDRSFVANLEDGDGEIARTIVNLAQSFGMQVVAEGIETEHQAERLRQFGCEYGQGFLFSRPMPEGDAANYLLRLQHRTDVPADHRTLVVTSAREEPT